VLVLRKRRGPGDGFRIPGGPVIPLVTVALCLTLLAQSDPSRLLKGGIALLVGVPLYALSRKAGWAHSTQ